MPAAAATAPTAASGPAVEAAAEEAVAAGGQCRRRRRRRVDLATRSVVPQCRGPLPRRENSVQGGGSRAALSGGFS